MSIFLKPEKKAIYGLKDKVKTLMKELGTMTVIQRHAEDGNYVAPDESFAVVNKKKKLLSF